MAFCGTRKIMARVLASSMRTHRSYATENKVGVIVGVYSNDGDYILTETADKINVHSSGSITQLMQYGGPLKTGKSRVLYGASEEFPVVAVVGLGKKNISEPLEERDEAKEAIRTAVAAGCQSLGDAGISKILVDPCGDGEAAAEGAHLSTFKYQDLKSNKKPIPTVHCFVEDNRGWIYGSTLAKGQNIARRLMEIPANILTPTNFAQEAVDCLEGLGVEVLTRSYEWAKERSMNAFLSVSQGSAEPPVFLELNYRGNGFSDEKPVAVVGKGITFDSGGISLKPSSGMETMKGDMGGAASTVGSIFIAAALRFPINIKGFIPLCENMPGGTATKPGDIVVASNGKSIQIDNTDAEGRLILADALHYASQYKPRAIIDIATLTGAINVALGSGATGVFTNCNALWELMHKAGTISGDRVWRMPLWKHYSSQILDFGQADMNNVGKYSRASGSCTAAAFLKEFVTCDHWMHMDIAGVMENKDEVPYLGKGMSGRPTRTVAHSFELMAKAESGL